MQLCFLLLLRVFHYGLLPLRKLLHQLNVYTTVSSRSTVIYQSGLTIALLLHALIFPTQNVRQICLTRSVSEEHVPAFRNSNGQRSFFHTFTIVWNYIPHHIYYSLQKGIHIAPFQLGYVCTHWLLYVLFILCVYCLLLLFVSCVNNFVFFMIVCFIKQEPVVNQFV